MTSFWIGFASGLGCYFAVGFIVGLFIIFKNLSRFHGGGFQYRRMAEHLGLVTLMWPLALFEMVAA